MLIKPQNISTVAVIPTGTPTEARAHKHELIWTVSSAQSQTGRPEKEPRAASHPRRRLPPDVSDCRVNGGRGRWWGGGPLTDNRGGGGWRATVMMEAVMEFQWGHLPEVDGRKSH